MNPACPFLLVSRAPHATAADIKYGKRQQFDMSHTLVTIFFFVDHGSFALPDVARLRARPVDEEADVFVVEFHRR
jgi:hypothetical protein